MAVLKYKTAQKCIDCLILIRLLIIALAFYFYSYLFTYMGLLFKVTAHLLLIGKCMLNTPLTQTLSLVWKLLTVLILPVIMAIYVKTMDTYYGPFVFADLDLGKNLHKWVVLAIYLAFLLC